MLYSYELKRVNLYAVCLNVIRFRIKINHHDSAWQNLDSREKYLNMLGFDIGHK